MRRRASWGFGLLALLLPALAVGGESPRQSSIAGARAKTPATLVSETSFHSGSSAHHSSGAHSSSAGGFSSSHFGHHHGGKGAAFGGGYYPFGVPYNPYYYYGVYGVGPLFVPADVMYGPGPLVQALGIGWGGDDGGGRRAPAGGMAGAGVINQPPPGGPVAGQPAPAGQLAPAGQVPLNADPPRKKVRATNAAAKARAGKFLQFGDTQFAKQKFHQALERYREGALAAPDLGDCFFRQGFAQIAMGQYDTAAKSFQRGLRIKPGWAESEFELISLYGAEHRLAKLSHREALAQAIEQSPQNADLLMVMGTVLYFDAERGRSRLFFERAAELGGNAEHLLDGFLGPRPADADKPRRANL